MMECRRDADRDKVAHAHPLEIKDGYMNVSTRPGLGLELDFDYLRGNTSRGRAVVELTRKRKADEQTQ